MYHVIPVTELEHLEPFREAWTRLVQEDPRAQFTQSLEWLESYWKCFGHDKFLECHVVMFGDEPVGFAPLILKNVPTHWGNVRLLTWPLDSWGGRISTDWQEYHQHALPHISSSPRVE